MTVLRLALCLLAIAFAGCFSESERCDPDQRYSYGLCYQIDAAVTQEAGSDASFEHFAEVCTGDTDCVAPTNFCAKYPSDPSGYCTRTGCLTDMAICPSGWSCLDLTVYAPGLPAICIKP